MKKFRIFNSDGKAEVIEGSRISWKKTKDGLEVKLFNGKKLVQNIKGVICLVEDMPDVIIAQPKNETRDDD